MKGLFAIAFALIFCTQTYAANIAAVTQDDGYSSRVLDKLINKWSIPEQLKPGQKISLTLSLDDEGKLQECRVLKGASSEALAKAICNAARAASPFGSPPYGLAADIRIAIWSGMASKATDTQTDETIDNATVQASTKTAPDNKPQDDPKFAKYISRVTWDLRKSIYIPEKTAKGVYNVGTRIQFDKNGKIIASSITKGSGDALLDKYVLQGIHRAGKIQTPPSGLGNTLDLSFRLSR